MGTISTLLVPFDFSKAAKNALEYTVAFTGRNDDIQIVLAHISGHGNFKLHRENFTKLEEKYSRVLKNKLQWTTQGGTVAQALLEIQKTKAIDLVIMGTFGTNKQSNEEQTNTSKLVLEANCPVLVVPWGYQDFKLKRIALVLGKEEIDDPEDLGLLLQFARRFNAKVHVITIKNQSGSYGYSEKEEKNEKAIEYYLEHFYTERVFIKNEDVVDGILTYASNCDIDLITILPRNHTKHSEPSKGQLTQLLTLHSKVPVLAIG